jgi:uncharacterized FlaG/YvyC family protein
MLQSIIKNNVNDVKKIDVVIQKVIKLVFSDISFKLDITLTTLVVNIINIKYVLIIKMFSIIYSFFFIVVNFRT